MKRHLAGVALTSATLLMTELALTRIFSVIMYYHFAFLAISIALFGLSASGVFAFTFRRTLDRVSTDALLSVESVIYALSTLVALFFLVRLRIGLTYSRHNLILMLIIYALAALPFFAGGMVVTLAIARLGTRVNAVYASDLIGAAAGCLVLIPLLDRLGAPGVVLTAAALALSAAALFAPQRWRTRVAAIGVLVIAASVVGHLSGVVAFDIGDAKGHVGDRPLFAKWNSFSRIGVYDRTHDNWSLSQTYTGPVPRTRYMDIDAAASTPILELSPDLSNAQFLRYELTAIGYRLARPGFSALVIGPGGGRDLVSALVFGAGRVDGVEINPIIADDVMRGQFEGFSGGIYRNPRVRIAIDDGRSFVRRAGDRYDIIQASLVDTWAATAAGAYTLTENTLYTVEAFNDYIDHLSDNGVLTMTRWVMDGLRLVSLAQEAGQSRGWDVSKHLAIVQFDRVQTFLLKRSEFTREEIATLRAAANELRFNLIYAPTFAGDVTPPLPFDWVDGIAVADYPRLIRADDRHAFYANYKQDIRPTTDDRPFFFHTTKLQDQFRVAFGREMLFGNGLSALLTLMAISAALVGAFVIGPLALARGTTSARWFSWLLYFGALGAGFMLIEVSVLQHFVLLLGHPVYALTVTLFSLLLGTGLGAALSRHLREDTLVRSTVLMLAAIAVVGVVFVTVATPVVTWAIPFARSARIAVAVAILLPLGVLLGVPMPSGLRLLHARAPQMVTWAWGINGALSVVGATVAIFVAMNWGFGTTLLTASCVYLIGLVALLTAL